MFWTFIPLTEHLFIYVTFFRYLTDIFSTYFGISNITLTFLVFRHLLVIFSTFSSFWTLFRHFSVIFCRFFEYSFSLTGYIEDYVEINKVFLI